MSIIFDDEKQNKNLADATQEYVESMLSANDYLSQRSDYARTTISGRQAYSIVLAGTSPITNRTEIATIYTTLMRNGDIFYVITVTPENEARTYNTAFRNMISSIRLTD